MNEVEFWQSEPIFFAKKLKGFNDLEFEREKREWEQTRWLGTMVVSPYSKKGLSPKDVLSFPWDKKPPKTKAEWIKENEAIWAMCNKLAEA
jgi:hypothetical protein